MLLKEAITTYFHFAGIFILIIALVVEYILFKQNLSVKEARLIGKADMWYGISSGIILVTGLLKMFAYGKGSAYYMNNGIFWTKIALFALVGLLSIIPTMRYLRWRKKLDSGVGLVLSDLEFKSTRIILISELILFAFIPLMANLMARGFGYYG